MLHLLDLSNNDLDALHEALRVVIVQYIHVYALITACKERITVPISLDTTSYGCKYECARIDGLEVASWHLQDDGICCWHNSHQLGATFDTSAALICLWLISWYFKF